MWRTDGRMETFHAHRKVLEFTCFIKCQALCMRPPSSGPTGVSLSETRGSHKKRGR